MGGRLAAAAIVSLAAAAAAAQTHPRHVASEEAALEQAGIVLPCRFGRFYTATTLPGDATAYRVRFNFGMLTHERRRRQAHVAMAIDSAFGPSDADLLALNRAILDDLLTSLTPVRDYSGAPGPAGAVGRVYRFEHEGRPALVGTILWRRGDRRIEITAWAYGSRHESVWRDIERLVREIATPREPRGRSRRCPALWEASPIPIAD